jgi:Glycosyl transferase family 2
MARPLISLTLIAKDESHNIQRCFDSMWQWVDEVVLVDTGSDDGTVQAAQGYAAEQGQPDKLIIGHFDWCDDFAAARQAADDLASGEFLIWMDLDDTVEGMENLRRLVADVSQDVGAFFCHYRYAVDQDGNTISELWRERIVRNDGTRWTGRLHEHKIIHRPVIQVDPLTAQWIHHRDHTQRTGERNLRVLEKWDQDEPDNPRIVQSIAMEYLGMERHAEAADTFARYLQMPGEPPDRRAQATRHMCVMLMIQNRVQEAQTAALTALQETWTWADTHLTLAEVAQASGRPDEGYIHAKQAYDLGKPNSLLILNPMQYTAHPLALMAICLGQMGKLEEAAAKLQECVAVAPSYSLALQAQGPLLSQLRKHRAALAWAANAQTLVEAGEPLKACALLDLAPWYVMQDERLVQQRAALSRMVADRRDNTSVISDPDAIEFAERMAA